MELRTTSARPVRGGELQNNGNGRQKGQNWPYRLRQRSPPLAQHPKMLTNHRGGREKRNYHRPGHLHSYTNLPGPERIRAWMERVGHTPHGHPATRSRTPAYAPTEGYAPLALPNLATGVLQPSKEKPKGTMQRGSRRVLPKGKHSNPTRWEPKGGRKNV